MMPRYKASYMKKHGYGIDDRILCEICGAEAVDIHHVKFRSHCTEAEKNDPDDLIAVCRECHRKFHE